MDGFIMENRIKMDDLGVPLFSETSCCRLDFKNSFCCLDLLACSVFVGGCLCGAPKFAQDSCNAPDSLEDEPSSEAIVQYELFRDALKATGRPVYLALSGWHNWYSPYGQSLANSWRIGYDVRNWLSAWRLGWAKRKRQNRLGQFQKKLGGFLV